MKAILNDESFIVDEPTFVYCADQVDKILIRVDSVINDERPGDLFDRTKALSKEFFAQRRIKLHLCSEHDSRQMSGIMSMWKEHHSVEQFMIDIEIGKIRFEHEHKTNKTIIS